MKSCHRKYVPINSYIILMRFDGIRQTKRALDYQKHILLKVEMVGERCYTFSQRLLFANAKQIIALF